MKCAHFTCHQCSEPHEPPGRTEYVVGLERQLERLKGLSGAEYVLQLFRERDGARDEVERLRAEVVNLRGELLVTRAALELLYKEAHTERRPFLSEACRKAAGEALRKVGT